jgi:hypothetical protein
MAADYAQLVLDLYNANNAPINDSLVRAIAYADAIKAFYESGSIQIGSLASSGSNSAGPVNSTNTSGGTFV